jgi:single-strand DNA-binding protein
MELIGTLKKISETQTFGSGFQKKEVVILTEEQYPQPISVEFTQDKIMLLDQFTEGDAVKISINIRGREWTAPDGVVKFFNSITGWRIERNAPAQALPTSNDVPVTQTAKNDNPFAEEDDDLPF